MSARGIAAGFLAAILGLPLARAQAIDSLLAAPAVLCGRFDQATTLVGISHAVRARGRFCVVPKQGVLWETESPFSSTLVVTRASIVELENGRTEKRMSAQGEPGVRAVASVLFSLLSGDLPSLRHTFDVTEESQGAHWHARLAPKSAALKGVIAGVELRGARYVTGVDIAEPSGDAIAISFTGITTGPSAISAAESALLASAGDSASR
jgi:hypothetical protein